MILERSVATPDDGLVVASSPRSDAAEAYRTLATNIQFSSLDRPVRTLLVTGATPDEDKTTVLANLAITLAATGRRVVVVDCDLRRPRLHAVFGVAEAPGLTSMILDETLRPPLQETSFPNVWVVTSGPLPPNPAELLGSERMGRAIAQIGADADYILFDAPPVTVVADAAMLAARLDGVLLVVASGRTRRETARRAKEQLDRVGARVLGTALSNVKPERTKSEYGATGP
ncbi:MAG: CpsD/CapB family tyrosine-protein kinase [Chloroflexota bacterium]|nr:CpsD/CapB family tyrosine-protein kinase [Chloroflexota bacterium]